MREGMESDPLPTGGGRNDLLYLIERLVYQPSSSYFLQWLMWWMCCVVMNWSHWQLGCQARFLPHFELSRKMRKCFQRPFRMLLQFRRLVGECIKICFENRVNGSRPFVFEDVIKKRSAIIWRQTSTNIPWSSVSSLLMNNPNPEPPYCTWVRGDAWLNLWKRSFFSFSSKPLPVSWTANRRYTSFPEPQSLPDVTSLCLERLGKYDTSEWWPEGRSRLAPMLTTMVRLSCPCVNLMAFVVRLISTCRRRDGSSLTQSISRSRYDLSILNSMAISFESSSPSNIFSARWTTAIGCTATGVTTSNAASNLDRDKISSMMRFCFWRRIEISQIS